MRYDVRRDPVALHAAVGLLENIIRRASKGSKAERQWLIDKDVAGQLVERRAQLARAEAGVAAGEPGYGRPEE